MSAPLSLISILTVSMMPMSPPAFVSVLSCSFTQLSHPRLCSSRHRRNRSLPCAIRHTRPRWFAVSGTPPPPSSPGDESSSSGSNDGNDNFSTGPSSSGENIPRREDRSDDGSRDSEFNLNLTITATSAEDENELFQFIKSVPPPELVKKFTESAPPVVQNAIRETLVSILGSLPPLAFYTTVSSMSTNLIQLFHSTLITGYMFRNAAYRLELTRTLDWTGLNSTNNPNKALPTSEDAGSDEPEIKGGVAIFKQPDGSTIEVPVDQYIGELRNTVTNLRDELVRERKGGNELLSFISTMDKENMDSLTKNAGSEVVDAMKKVVDFVTASQGIDKTQNAVIEASAPELGQLLFYLMVSGFFLREAEVRRDLQNRIGGESQLNNLLGGGSSPGDSGSSNAETPPDSSPPSSPSGPPASDS